MWVVRSESLNPWHNLALEELCFDRVKQDDRLLFLWQSSDTVVVGKNQNPWHECSLPAMEKGKVNLARRLSGGGAVFHDAGNLNFAFFMPRSEYKATTIFSMVINTLKQFGVQTTMMGRSSLGIHGRKVSGNAFCYRQGIVLHHGTLLVSTDLGKMNRYLGSAHAHICSRAIGSNPVPVMNLRDVMGSISIPQLGVALAETAAAEWERKIQWGREELFDPNAVKSVETKYSSWEWRYGMTPRFEVEMGGRFSWGTVRVVLFVERGIVRRSELDLQGKYQAITPTIHQALVDVRFSERDVMDHLQTKAPLFETADAMEFTHWLLGS